MDQTACQSIEAVKYMVPIELNPTSHCPGVNTIKLLFSMLLTLSKMRKDVCHWSVLRPWLLFVGKTRGLPQKLI
jgi:hypothetical protein